MSWNYRLVKYRDGSGYGLHEVFYDENGEEQSMSGRAVGFTGATPEEVQEALMTAARDMRGRPVFVEPESWVAPLDREEG